MTAPGETGKAPYAAADVLAPSVVREAGPDGTTLLRSPVPLGPYPDHLIQCLHGWARTAPERDFLCERRADGSWRRLTYGMAARQCGAIAQAMIVRGHGPDRPVAILSDNSIDFALVQLAVMQAGAPAMAVSPAYSVMSQDHAKLKAVMAHHDPSLIFVENPAPFEAAMEAIGTGRAARLASVATPGWDLLTDWAATPHGAELEARTAGIGPETVAKILLTSGSTGQPKGVINTQRMMCANQQMMRQAWPFLDARPPVLVDWLPWNHTFGGNFCFNMALTFGGTFYVDGGKPAPGRIDETLRNLREISPTLYLNVPKGYDLLVPALEADAALRDTLFRELDILFFAGAALPQNLRERLEALSVAARGERVPILTSLGATETAPAATFMTTDSDVWGNIGVPLPGCEAKLVPNGEKSEVRFRGPNVTPGYYGEPELTEAAFDADGYFAIGDAARWLNPDDPAQGLLFDGRVAENFKLISGTWVAAGTLRLAAISACDPAVQDAVVTGHDRDSIGILVFPNLAGCRSLCPGVADGELLSRPEIRDCLAEGLARHNAANPASSTRIVRALILAEPPQIDAGEITDKGYVNQRAVLERRAGLVARLHADPPGADVIVVA